MSGGGNGTEKLNEWWNASLQPRSWLRVDSCIARETTDDNANKTEMKQKARSLRLLNAKRHKKTYAEKLINHKIPSCALHWGSKINTGSFKLFSRN